MQNRMKRVTMYAVAIAGMSASVTLLLRSQEPSAQMPLVNSADMPLYPPIAVIAHVQGTVQLQVKTDGKRATEITAISGPEMLKGPSITNVGSWRFSEHKPTQFITKFDYAIVGPGQCYMTNPTVNASLPLAVHISAQAVTTCDPSTTKEHR